MPKLKDKMKKGSENAGPSGKDPFTEIEDFFSAAALDDHRKHISSMLKAAYSAGYWKKSYPGALLNFQDQMLKLIGAAHIFVRDEKNHKSKKAVAIMNADAFGRDINLVDYAGIASGNPAWEFFPRHLKKSEYLNPFRVFEKFFKYKKYRKWRRSLKKIVSYALSPDGKESALEFDYLLIYLHLQKLVEAAHLIDIRINKRVLLDILSDTKKETQ